MLGTGWRLRSSSLGPVIAEHIVNQDMSIVNLLRSMVTPSKGKGHITHANRLTSGPSWSYTPCVPYRCRGGISVLIRMTTTETGGWGEKKGGGVEGLMRQ